MVAALITLLCSAHGFYDGVPVASSARYTDLGNLYPWVEIFSKDAGDFSVDVVKRGINFEPKPGVIGLKIFCQSSERTD